MSKNDQYALEKNVSNQLAFNGKILPSKEKEFVQKQTILRQKLPSNREKIIQLPQPLRTQMKNYSDRNYDKDDQDDQVQRWDFNIYNQIASIGRLPLKKNCSICQVPVMKQVLSVADCSHYFCENCLNRYVNYRIRIFQPIVCPNQNCQIQMNQNGKFFHDLPHNLKNKYINFKVQRASQAASNKRLCPRQDCKGGLINQLQNPLICQKCGNKPCRQCQLESHQGPCQAVFLKTFKDWKRCPKCKVFSEKLQESNHIVCICMNQFCYFCLKKWQPKHQTCLRIKNRSVFQVPETKCESILLFLVYLLLYPLFLLMVIFVLPIGLIICSIIFPLAIPLNLVFGNKLWLCIIGIVFYPVIVVLSLPVGIFLGIYIPFQLLFCPKFQRLTKRTAILWNSLFQ